MQLFSRSIFEKFHSDPTQGGIIKTNNFNYSKNTLSDRYMRASLDKYFPYNWIGRRGPIEFPARSPDRSQVIPVIIILLHHRIRPCRWDLRVKCALRWRSLRPTSWPMSSLYNLYRQDTLDCFIYIITAKWNSEMEEWGAPT